MTFIVYLKDHSYFAVAWGKCLFIYLFILFIYLFVYLFIYYLFLFYFILFIYLFIYLFISNLDWLVSKCNVHVN